MKGALSREQGKGRQNMVTVTEDARKLLGMVLFASNVVDPELALRLLPCPDGEVDLMLDKEREGDQVVKHEGAKVLLVGEEILAAGGEVTIDFQHRGDSRRLVMLRS